MLRFFSSPSRLHESPRILYPPIHPPRNSAIMSGEAWLYLFAVLINAVNLFLQVFFTIMYSDLEWLVTRFPSCALSGVAQLATIGFCADGLADSPCFLFCAAY